MKEAGGNYEDKEVIVDGNLITSRQPSDLPAFMKEIMKKRVALKDNRKEERNEAKREELKRLFDIETSVERFLADYK